MAFAEWEQPFDVGELVVDPFVEVVDLAVGRRGCSSRGRRRCGTSCRWRGVGRGWRVGSRRRRRVVAVGSEDGGDDVGGAAVAADGRRAGSGMPSMVSHSDWSCQPPTKVWWSRSTMTSGTRWSRASEPVMSSMNASASSCSWVSGANGSSVGSLVLLVVERAELGVQRGEDLGVGFGVELGVDVAHAGLAVDPGADVVLGALTLQLRRAVAVLGSRRRWSGRGRGIRVRTARPSTRRGASCAGRLRGRRTAAFCSSVSFAVALAIASRCPAVIAPSPRASPSDGQSARRSSARPAAALASRLERRPCSRSTSAGDSDRPSASN